MSAFTTLSQQFPISLFAAELLLLGAMASLWLLRFLAFRHLQDVKPERQAHYLHRQWLRSCWVGSALLLVVAASIWWFAAQPIVPICPSTKSPYIDSCPAIEPPTPALPPSAVLDLFEATESIDATIEATKTRYEHALSGAYILHHCERITKDEVDQLSRILQQHLQRLTEDPDYAMLHIEALYNSIVSAAEGSYQMVYSKIPCDKPEILLLEQQFLNFLLQTQPPSRKNTPQTTP